MLALLTYAALRRHFLAVCRLRAAVVLLLSRAGGVAALHVGVPHTAHLQLTNAASREVAHPQGLDPLLLHEAPRSLLSQMVAVISYRL